MATGNAIDYGWYLYTDNLTNEWSMKVDKDWGDLAAAGFGARVPSRAAWPGPGGRYRARRVLLMDPVSGRTTTRPVGSPTAAILTPGTTVATKARGASGTYMLESVGEIPERRPHVGAIVSKAEPITT